MRFPHWLRPLAAHFNPVRKRRTRSRQVFRPRLESLEDRITPTAIAPPNGLTNWWPADGNLTDIAGGSNRGGSFRYAPGEVGQAFEFDGTFGGISATSGNPDLNPGPRTIEAWVKPDGNTGRDMVIFTFTSSDQPSLSFPSPPGAPPSPPPPPAPGFFDTWFGIDESAGSGGPYSLYIQTAGGNWSSTAAVTPGVWNHIALTYDGTNTVQFFVNGQSAGVATPGVPAPLQLKSIGPESPDNPGFSGEIDEISLYNRVLSPAEIQSIYQSGPDGKNKFFVQLSDRADGETVYTAPTDFLVRLSQPYDPAFVQPGALLVNGLPATSMTQTDAQTLIFHYAASPVTVAGPQTMQLVGGTILSTGTETGLADWTRTFTYAPPSTPPASPPVTLRDSAGNSAQSFNEGDTVTFDASSKDAEGGTIVNYQWDFNGDGWFDATGAQVTHSFEEDGVHPVTLKETDNFGNSIIMVVDVIVNEVLPTVALGSGLGLDANGNWTAPEGQTIYLNGSLYDPDPQDHQPSVPFSWTVTKNGTLYASANDNPSASVGDTTTSDSFSFTPDDNGTYVVTLSGSDTDGSATDSQTIDVTNVAPTTHLTPPAELLDPAFGTGGRVTRDFTTDDSPSSAALQPDGKIVVAGSYVQSDGTVDTYVARFLANGQLDAGFGNDGVVVLDGNGYAAKILVQSTGKIVVSTLDTVSIPYKQLLLRLNPDGTLDTGFGPDQTGVVTPPVSGSIALEGDQILLAGTNNNSLGIVLARLTPDGILDTSFGADGTGIVTAAPVRPPFVRINSVFCEGLIVSGSNILVGAGIDEAGFGSPLGGKFGGPFAVARFDSNGNLDPSFVGPDGVDPTFQQHGWAITPGELQDPSGSINAMAVQPDGKIVLLGNEGSLVRFAADGALDSDVQLDEQFIGYDTVTCQPDGKLFIGGSEGLNPPQTPAGALVVTRLNPDLTPDLTFGTSGDGQAMLQFDQGVDSFLSNVLLQPDGNIVVVGASYTQLPDSSWNGDLQLARFLAPSSPFHEGETIALQGSGYDPSPVDSQSLTYSWTVTRNGAAYQTASGADYSLLFADDGSYIATLTVSDKDGGSSSVSGYFSVSNVPPTAGITGPDTAVVDQTLSFTLGASDPSPDDQAAGFTYTVDWGDGTSGAPDVQTFTASPGNGAGLTVTHAYAAAGAYTVLVTATDKDGGVSTAVSTAVQVNAVTAANLQQVVSPSNPVTIQVNSVADATAVVQAINDLTSQSATVSGTVSLDLAPITYGGLTVTVPDGMTLVIGTANYTGGQQATIDPDSPAFTVASGNVIVNNVKFVTTGAAPTILVTGGSLTLRDDTIQESTGYSDAAIEVTGGTVDLGTAADPGGNTININGSGAFVTNTTAIPIASSGTALTVNGVALAPDSLSGIVFEDFNDDGQVDFGEQGIAGVAVALTGTDFLGNAVSMSATTDSDGAYIFANLQPGTYSITETQPAGYNQGVDTVGTAGGSLTATDQFFVSLAQDAFDLNGLNYNFGEQPQATGSVQKGQTAGIGFWNNKNGQTLINNFNGGPASTQLAAWLADTLPHIFGVDAGSNALIHADGSYFTNAEVAARFQQDFVLKGVKLDAQVLATALSVYATNATLDDTGVAANYGFLVSGDGVGTAGVNVGSNGDAFGVANNTVVTVLDLLKATDALAVDGLLYNGDAVKRKEANSVYSAINDAGNLG